MSITSMNEYNNAIVSFVSTSYILETKRLRKESFLIRRLAHSLQLSLK